jgi:xylulokinase
MLVGGGSRSRFWAQIIADVTANSLDLVEGGEHGAAAGAARLSMLAAGFSMDAVCTPLQIREKVTPGMIDPQVAASRRAAVLRLYSNACVNR